MNTIVAMSWTIDQPIAARPWRLSISPLSIRDLRTTRVDEIDRQAPTTKAPPQPEPRPTISAIPAADDQRDLGDPAGQRDPRHVAELPERELDAQREQEQDDADVGQGRDLLDVADEAGRERPDQDAREQVADDRRLAKADGDRAAHEGRRDRAAEPEDELELFGQDKVEWRQRHRRAHYQGAHPVTAPGMRRDRSSLRTAAGAGIARPGSTSVATRIDRDDRRADDPGVVAQLRRAPPGSGR